MGHVLEDIAVFLPAAGLGLVFGTNLFAGLMPNQPDSLVAVFEYPGEAPEYMLGPTSVPTFTHPRIQVVVRDPDYLLGRTLIGNVTKALEAVVNQSINSTLYQRIERLQDPFLLHRDQARRTLLACNFAVNKASE